jgi:HlyD family secretion protein
MHLSSSDVLATPPRPADDGAVLAGLVVVALFIGGFGAWASIAPLSSAAIAPGEVKVESHHKTLQHMEGGIIREILVRDGDLVQKGQLLLRIDDTKATATVDSLEAERTALMALEARLTAERDNAVAIEFPQSLAASGNPAVATMIAGQQTIFDERQKMLAGQIDILEQRVLQLRSEIGGYEAQMTSLATQAELIETERAAVAKLVAKGLERKTRLLALERQAASIAGSRGEKVGLIAKAEQAIGEAAMQAADLKNKRKTEIVTSLRDVQLQLAGVQEKVRAAADVQRRTDLLAPETGKVVNLRYFTPGGIIRPGDPILDIVPQDDRLIVHARVKPADIETLRPGLVAEIRFTAFKQRRTPLIVGTVADISADTLTNRNTGEAHYLARIHISPDELRRVPDLQLYPGMPTEVMIVTGERSAFGYLLDPVLDSFSRAFRGN